MIKIILRTQGLFLLVAIGVNCGGGNAATLTQSEFCSQKADKECTAVADKCLATSSKCKAARVAACEAFATAQQANPSAAARPFRPEKATACLNKTAEIYAKPTITPADRGAMDDLCARVFSGSKKDNDTDPSCSNDYECDASQICDPGFSSCAVKKTVATDANCNNPGEGCPAAQFCATGNPRKCMPRATVGQTCDSAGSPCLDTLRCAAGTCAERMALGGACSTNGDCLPAAPYCDSFNGNVCDTGFIPSQNNSECVGAFGATGTAGGGTGGASGGAGTGGAGGAA